MDIVRSIFLKGSGASLLDCVNWAVRSAGLPLTDVLRMTTTNPARLLGVGRRAQMARLRGGPDLVVMDQQGTHLTVRHTIVGGRLVYSRPA